MRLSELRKKEDMLAELQPEVEKGVKEQLKEHPVFGNRKVLGVELEWTEAGIIVHVDIND